jgi:hypothetical protein
MSIEDALAGIPAQGFLKTRREPTAQIDSKNKVALIRRGNELLKKGDWDQAKRIFMTAGNTDGMVRLGDHYMEIGDPLLALEMYMLAPAPDKAEPLIRKMALVVQEWLKE